MAPTACSRRWASSPPSSDNADVPGAQYPREIANWALVSVGMGAVEGSLAGSLVLARYGGEAPGWLVDIAVALVAGAPAWSNLASFLFATHQLGRDKVALTVRWQALALGCVLALALVPEGGFGLLATVLLVIGARIGWVGVITLRAVVWRRNFPDAARARLASRLTALNAVLMAGSAGLLGWLLTHAPAGVPGWFAVAGAIGLIGAWRYRAIRVRGHGSLRASEARLRTHAELRPSLAGFRRVLASDPLYARYMRGMFVFGSGNLMLPAPVLLVLAERLALEPARQVLLLTVLPLLVLPFAVGAWARLLDRVRIIRFRAVHAWSFVGASAAFLLGCVGAGEGWLWLGSLLMGVGIAGGQLGWNLGHNDFSRPEQAAVYMGVHVTLTGVRGLAAPLVGVLAYRGLESVAPGQGAWMLLLPLALNLAGAIAFARMRGDLP